VSIQTPSSPERGDDLADEVAALGRGWGLDAHEAEG